VKRLAYFDLVDWLHSEYRKPLIMFGARQVGKTHLARMVGELMPNFVEINLEDSLEASNVFLGNLDPERILRELSLITGSEIIPGKTLLFLDEIQENPRAITALRYFYEKMPQLHVMAAGSLLDFAIDKVGVPVGRVTFRWIYPMSFIEFLCALGHNLLAEAIISQPADQELSSPIHEKALELVGEYMAIGGMPEAVLRWRDTKNILHCQEIQSNLVTAYERDFLKYAKKNQVKYVELLFHQTPRHITKQFNYGLLETGYKKRELAPAIQLLTKARVVTLIHHTHGTGVPLGAELDQRKFKLIMLDIAITQALLGHSIKDWFLNPTTNLANKGEIAEAFVGQELLAYSPPNREAQLYYWQREQPGAKAEVDYLIALKNHVIPVEVKSGHGAQLQSLRMFLQKRPKSPFGIRFSVYNYSYIDQLQNYPLYAVACVCANKDLIRKLIKSKSE